MVRSTFAGFSTALSALQANQKRLDIVGQNLSNMNTPGYTRQELKTSSLNYTSPVSKYMNGSEIIVGFGVHMDKVTQIRDPYLDIQYRDQMQKSGYTDGIQTSLDRLAKVLDESNIDGINSAFNDILDHLFNMQDPSKVNDAIYETELRTRIKALTNLLNEADRQITEAERQEYMQLDGRNSSENGSVEQVNDILMRVGNLNRQIKQNQILGQQSLELMDERNLLLDELSSYIPIEVTYYKDQDHDGVDNTDATKEDLGETYHLDSNGNPMYKKEWPDDLRVEMLYTDANGKTQRLTLVEGTEGSGHDNYGELTLTPTNDATKGETPYPEKFTLTFTGSKENLIDGKQETLTLQYNATNNAGGIKGSIDGGTAVEMPGLTGGSIQASLDMLWQKGVPAGTPYTDAAGATVTSNNKHNDWRGYEYYRDQLNTLARGFADVMNKINISGTSTDPTKTDDTWYLLANKTNNTSAGITAGNIGINSNWVSGAIHVSMAGKDPNDTILYMIEAMKTTYPYDTTTLTEGTTAMNGANPNLKNNTFADFMNNVSTTLATDSYTNSYNLKNNVTVLNAIENSRDSISGVSMDEEASNMMMFQSAYNAASRLMTALDEVLNTLINSTGVCGR